MPKKNSSLKPKAAVEPSGSEPLSHTPKPAAKKRKKSPSNRAKASGKSVSKADYQLPNNSQVPILMTGTSANIRVNVLKSIGLAVLMLILVLALDIFGIYKFGWRDNFSRQVAAVLMLPAGMVDGKSVSLADYLDDLKLLENSVKQKREGLVENYFTANYGNNIFLRLAADKLVRKKLAGYSYDLSDQKISAQMQDIIKQIGGRDQAQKMVDNLYGLNLPQFQSKILAPLMGRDALQQLITKDESLEINKKAKARAEEVLRLAQIPRVDFAQLANQYTEDEAGINTGGEMGWMTKNEINPEWGEEIFSLPANTVYGKLIKNRIGYHIVKVEGRAANQETGETSVKLRQILILVDVDLYIKELLDAAKLIRYFH